MEKPRYPCCIAPVDTTFMRTKPLIGGSTLTEEQVLEITNAKQLENVKRLNVWSCDLSDIKIIRKLPNLEVCSVSSNFIESLEDFKDCVNLKELFARNNNISELHEICHLKNLVNLRVLWIDKNPVSQLEGYRETVLRALPHLEKLDNLVVTSEEVNLAQTNGMEICLPDQKEPTPHQQEEVPRFSNWKEAITHSIEEINKVRAEHGLPTLSLENLMPDHYMSTHNSEREEEDEKEEEKEENEEFTKNTHILQAVLQLVKELDELSLKLVRKSIDRKLETMGAV